jgi:Bacterial extracellular solute-binding proteins, family 5 Middle
MKLRLSLLIAGSSAIVLLTALPVKTARRPRYGGTLRVEIGTSVKSLDPAVPAANSDEEPAKEQIDSLVYDVLEPKSKFTVNGAFHVTTFEAGKRAVLAATEDYRLGRPFVDSIEIAMGRGARERILDLELNKADFAEIPAEDARRAADHGIRVSRSKPDELLVLVFLRAVEPKRTRLVDARAREAIALSIDRAAIVNFILQKEGEPAGGLLPQWSSGTAFLFSTAADVVHAKELSAQIVPVPKIVLGYDSGDSLEQAVAERIAVDAREARVQLTAQAVRPGLENGTDARLVRLRMQSKSPRLALEGFVDALGTLTKIEEKPLPDPASAEDIYNRERAIVGSYRVVPLVWLPRVYGLSGRVRDWTPPGPGEEWPLADVWLDGPVEAAVEEGKK